MLALFLKQIPLSDIAGMVARGEAIGGEEAERLEAERAAARSTTDSADHTSLASDDGELTRLRG